MTRLLLLALVLVASMSADANKDSSIYRGNFYGYGSFGACQHGYGLFGGGGGAEGLLWKGVSAGVDGSYNAFTDGWGFGLLSAQGGYHFVNRKKPLRWDPFVTAGYGIVWAGEGGVGPTGNLGGGATYWIKPKIGIRFEFRAHGMSEEFMATGRIGVSFR